jgi:hypothetical protein
MKAAILFVAVCMTSSVLAQQPDWCKGLPRPAYGKLERVSAADPWFEVYKIRPGVFAIYEPHQLEEVISYLIIGSDKALLFDTGMGISNIQAVVAGLTKLPVSVVNSHTHNDQAWETTGVSARFTGWTRISLAPTREDPGMTPRQNLSRARFAEPCRPGSMPGHILQNHFTSRAGCMTATALTWVHARCR